MAQGVDGDRSVGRQVGGWKGKKMRIYAVNGTSFVGKTTLLKCLHARLPGTCAVLDGDDVARIQPFQLTRKWLDLIQDNILACARNFDRFGVDFFLFAFPFPNMARIGRLNRIFQDGGTVWTG